MTTPLLHINRGARDAASDILTELLDARDSLPSAGNNKAPYPSESYACYAHKELVSGRGPVLKGLEHLMAISLCNIDDRMPLPEAKRWLYRAERFIDVRAAEQYRDPSVRPISSAFRHEQRANCAFDLDELRVVEHRRNPEALRAAIRSGRAQLKATEDALQALEHEYATLVTHDSEVFNGSLVGGA